MHPVLCKRLCVSQSPIVKQKNPSFCVKPSCCLQVGACTKNGEGRMEMSEKCQMPAGSVQCISPADMFTPGRRVPAKGDCGGPRSNLLVALNKTCINVL